MLGYAKFEWRKLLMSYIEVEWVGVAFEAKIRELECVGKVDNVAQPFLLP